jgi:hypothetical protein
LPKSNKTPVIDDLWDMLQAEGNGRMVVTFDDVQEAIARFNADHKPTKPLSSKNPANFMKDIVRNDNASGNWPKRLCELRIGGRQRVGHNRVLEFVPYAEGQVEPFPNRYMPSETMEPIQLQSLSLPLASKTLGRKDESWLIQVGVHLHVVEQHFALHNSCKVRELTHLQVGVKLSGSEVDSLFRAVIERPDGTLGNALVTCEAKQHGERILEHQIVEQIVAANASLNSVADVDFKVDFIIPIALKAIQPKGRIYLVEFKPWTREEAARPEEERQELGVASEALYELVPPVPGIGYKPPKPRKPRKSQSKKGVQAAADSAPTEGLLTGGV